METTRMEPGLLVERRARSQRWLAWRWRLGLRWVGGTAAALVCATLLLIAMLHPSPAHIGEMTLYLAISGAVSLVVGEVALWLADVAQVGSVRVKLAIPSLLTALVIALNVVLVAHQMFISVVDSQMALAFLAFGVAVALVISASIAAGITASIARIEAGARRIADGDYDFRIAENDPQGSVELSRLAHWFNQMGASVRESFARQRRAEDDRRGVVAAVSHDLRTPLTSVRAMVEAIDDGVVTDAETIRRYHRTMRAELRHLTVLLDDLFMLSRLESGALSLERQPLAMDDMISDALEMMATVAAQSRIELVGHADGELPPASLDARQMYRVLTNLLQNALRHSPREGGILIQATSARGTDGKLEALVRVIDAGEGIHPDDLPHVFERTYRGEASRTRDSGADHMEAAGAGLGLAIAKGIVEAHGGRIWAQSPLPEETRALLASALPDRDHSRPGAVVSFALPVVRGARGDGIIRSVPREVKAPLVTGRTYP